MKVTLTSDPRQLLLDFDAPIAEVIALTHSRPTFGMPVSLDWDGPASITVSAPGIGVLGHVMGHLVQTLGRMLSAVDVTIDAALGEIDDRAFEVIVNRVTDDGTFRNVVRCVRVDADIKIAV